MHFSINRITFPILLKLFVLLFILSAVSFVRAQELKKIDSLERSLVEAPEPKQKMNILNRLAAEMMEVNIHLAKRYADSAIQLGQQTDYPSGLGMSYLNAGMERWLNGYYEEAETYYKRATDIYLKLNDSSKLATTYSYLGISYHYHAANDSALHYHFKAKSINESLGDMRRVAHNLDNIALAYQHKGQFDKVIEYSSRALEIRTNLQGYTSRTNVYNYGGMVFSQKAFEEAIKYQKKALYHLDSAYSIAASMHYNPFLAKLLYLKSKIFIQLKDYERAKENALSGLDMALKINVRSSIMNGYEILAKISKLQENYREALEYLSKHVQLKDSLYNGESSLQLAQTQVVFETNHKKDQYSSIHIPEYLHTLVNTIGDSFGYDQGSFDFETRIDDIHLDIDPAIKLGLITNELITNVFKHAFKQRKLNVLRIDFTKGQNEWVLTIADNGPGVTLKKLGSSGNFGIFLVKNLVADLNGEIQFETKNGTIVNIVWKPLT